jgi:hypothetical protein
MAITRSSDRRPRPHPGEEPEIEDEISAIAQEGEVLRAVKALFRFVLEILALATVAEPAPMVCLALT